MGKAGNVGVRGAGEAGRWVAGGWLAAVAVWSAPTHAAGPYIVDDAGITAPGRLQLETWGLVGANRDHVVVFNPATTLPFLPMIEWSLTYEVGREAGERADSLGVEAKLMLLDPEEQPLGLAIGIGLGRDLRDGQTDDLSATAIATLALRDALFLHANAGVARRPNSESADRTQTLGGLGLEWQPRGLPGMFAEVFGRTDEPVGFQLGIRPTLGGSGIDLDIAFARNPTGRKASWFTLGLTTLF